MTIAHNYKCKMYQTLCQYWHVDELKVRWDDGACKRIHKKVSLKKLPQSHKIPSDTKYDT